MLETFTYAHTHLIHGSLSSFKQNVLFPNAAIAIALNNESFSTEINY